MPPARTGAASSNASRAPSLIRRTVIMSSSLTGTTGTLDRRCAKTRRMPDTVAGTTHRPRSVSKDGRSRPPAVDVSLTGVFVTSALEGQHVRCGFVPPQVLSYGAPRVTRTMLCAAEAGPVFVTETRFVELHMHISGSAPTHLPWEITHASGEVVSVTNF